MAEFGIQPSEFWNMSIKEWFWVAKYKAAKAKAEAEAMGQNSTAPHVPEHIWDELREQRKIDRAANG